MYIHRSGTVSSPSDSEFVESFREIQPPEGETVAQNNTSAQTGTGEQQLYSEVDRLLEGGDDDKEKAYALLLKHKSEVCRTVLSEK